MKHYLIVLMLLSVTLANAQSVQSILTGRASYYGKSFHGKPTASGEVYNLSGFTCAHRTLPFNTWVRVTNTHNGKSVNLRVTDRGPYNYHRVLDVSQAAAKYLGMVDRGTTDVKVEVLENSDLSNLTEQALTAAGQRIHIKPDTLLLKQIYSPTGQKAAVTGFAFQVNVFKKFENALQECKYLCSKGIETVHIMPDNIQGQTLYRVMAGNYNNKVAANKDSEKFKNLGYDAFIIDVSKSQTN